MQSKYVMTKRKPVTLSHTFLHANFKSLKPVSAGMFSVKDGEVEVFGRSLSLDLNSRLPGCGRDREVFGVE